MSSNERTLSLAGWRGVMCDICDYLGQWVCRCGFIVNIERDGEVCPACGCNEDGVVELPDFTAHSFVAGQLCDCSDPDFGVWALYDSDELTALRGCYTCRSLEVWSGCYGVGDSCSHCEAVRGLS